MRPHAVVAAPAGFYGAMDVGERAALEAAGRRRHHAPGAALFHEGDESDWLAVLLSGRVKASYFTQDGREIVLAIRDPGDLLGELSALDNEPRSATVTALEDVEVLVLTASAFKRFLEEHPRLALVVIQGLSRRLRDADVKRVEFGAFDSIGRVARRLVELADRFGEVGDGAVRIAVPLSQQELAGWTGCSRESVTKALVALRGLGWVETSRKHFVLRDVEALRRRAH